MPRSSQAASCSGSTASPTSGTNAISPSPAVARIDATVASTTISSTTPKIPATSRRLVRMKRATPTSPARTLTSSIATTICVIR